VAVLRAAAALVCAACGLGGASGGGGDNLPLSGVGPYAKLTDFESKTPIDEPFIVIDPIANVRDPAPLALTGTAIRLFYTRTETGGADEIWRVDLPALTEPHGDAVRALAADADWEGGRVAAPSILADPHDPGRLLMYYEGAGGIGRAVSTDGGLTWSKDGRVFGYAHPSVVYDGKTFFLYYTKPGSQGIYVVTSTDGRLFVESEEAQVLMPRPGKGFDAVDVAEPSATGGVTEAGEVHFGLLYVGTNADGLAAIGYAGSRDGLDFEAASVPIMDPVAPSEHGPGLLASPTRPVLFFSQSRAGRTTIAAALTK
jgi:hypothetical protein